MRTYVRMMQMLLMAGIAASQSTTTAISTTTAVSTTGVQNTTTPIQITQPITLVSNNTFCRWVWGAKYREKGSLCDFYQFLDYGFVFGSAVWGFCAIVYIALRTMKQTDLCGWKLPTGYPWMFVSLIELVLILLFWPMAIVVPLVFYGYRACFGTENCDCFDSPPEQASVGGGNANSVNNASSTQTAAQTATPLVTRPAGEAPGAQFNQRFPKISPCDCRPKYSRVQTSAC
jgi:hypothetical protein